MNKKLPISKSNCTKRNIPTEWIEEYKELRKELREDKLKRILNVL